MSMKHVYLVATLIGLVVPITLIVPWMQANGMDMGLATDEFLATDMARIGAFDLGWSALVAAIFMAVEGTRKKIPLWWLGILGYGVGMCFGLPLFMYLRERALEKNG